MLLKVGDKVKLTVTKDALDRLNLKGASLNGKIATILKTYSLDYAPDQPLYNVELEDTIEHEGEEVSEIFDLTDSDLDPFDIVEERVANFSKFIKESLVKDETWYVGIADCNGIESFIKEPLDQEHLSNVDRLHDLGLVDDGAPTRKDLTKDHNQMLNMLSLRAMHNPQRHPVVYRVRLSQKAAALIEELLDSQEYEEALIMLKDLASETQLARGHGGNIEKRWKMIPNRDLDPFS